LPATSKSDPPGAGFLRIRHIPDLSPVRPKVETMTALPTFGGNNAFAYFNNNIGQAVGRAQSNYQDTGV